LSLLWGVAATGSMSLFRSMDLIKSSPSRLTCLTWRRSRPGLKSKPAVDFIAAMHSHLACRITTAYPRLSCIVLNAGFQRTVNFTHPETISCSLLTSELHTNYLSPLHTISLFLPHFISLGKTSPNPTPASIVLVSSGLAIVPIARCANYCATKSAMRSLAWTLRSQLSAPSSPETQHIRVIEIIPPAVQTELHVLQPDLAKMGQRAIGVPLNVFSDETWSLLTAKEGTLHDEMAVELVRERWEGLEKPKREAFHGFEAMFRKMVSEGKGSA
jgi:short-subunit dehydrogenase involved in D-alanine esterification of teichoic acids